MQVSLRQKIRQTVHHHTPYITISLKKRDWELKTSFKVQNISKLNTSNINLVSYVT